MESLATLCLLCGLAAFGMVHAGEPPTFIRSPQPTAVPYAHSVRLTAETTFEPTLRWQWRKNGVLLSGPHTESATLPLYNALPSDSGTYQAVASNSFGQHWSDPAEIVVLPAPNNPGRLDETFTDPGADGPVSVLVAEPGSDAYFAAGEFFSARGLASANKLCRLGNGLPDVTFRPDKVGPNGSIFALAAGNTALWVAGNFTSFDAAPSAPLVKLNLQGQRDLSYTPNLPANLEDIRVLTPGPAGTLYVGGRSRVNTTVTDWLVRLLPNGTRDNSFTSPLFLNGRVRACALRPDNKIWVAGNFFRNPGLNSQFNRLALVSPLGGAADASFTPPTGTNSGANLEIRSLHILPNGDVLVGGVFNKLNGISRLGLARVTANGTLVESFNPPALDDAVQALSSDTQGHIYAAGDISQANTTPIRSVIRLDASTGQLDPTWQPPMLNGPVQGLLMTPNGLLAHGQFDIPHRSVIRLAVNSGPETPASTSQGLPQRHETPLFRPQQRIGTWSGPQTMPDTGTQAFPVNMPGPGTLAEIHLWLELRHADVQSLDISLQPPPSLGLAPITIVSGAQLRHGAHFLRTHFTAQSLRPLAQAAAPFTDTIQPLNDLQAPLFGKNFAGTWNLQITDNRSDSRSATILSWNLEIITPATSPTLAAWQAQHPNSPASAFPFAGHPATEISPTPGELTHHCWPNAPIGLTYRYWESNDLTNWRQVQPLSLQKTVTPTEASIRILLASPETRTCWWRITSP